MNNMRIAQRYLNYHKYIVCGDQKIRLIQFTEEYIRNWKRAYEEAETLEN